MSHAKGTGGLTLEPPSGALEDVGDIGFAPDLMGSAEGAPVGSGPETSAPKTASAAPYPRARAAIAVLLGEAEPTTLLSGDDGRLPGGLGVLEDAGELRFDDASLLGVDLVPPGATQAPLPERLEAGPAITRRRYDVRRPPPAPAAPEPDDTDAQMEDMVEMVLVGGDDGEVPSVHLMFKADTFGGMYLKLERQPEGLFARFSVKDASTRRQVDGQVDMLLSRLRDRGMKIAGYEIVVGE